MQDCYHSSFLFDEVPRDIHEQTFDRDAHENNNTNTSEDFPPDIKQQFAFFDDAQLHEVLVISLQYLVR